jgi:hypothetical protein
MLAEIEANILAKLQTTLSTPARMRLFPENAREFGSPAPKGQILIGYKRSSFNEISQHPSRFEQLAEFELSLQFSNLRTHSGVLPVLDQIRTALLGYFPLGGMPKGLYPIAETFADLDDGIWYYTSTWVACLIIPGEYTEPVTETPIELTELRIGLWRSLVDEAGNQAKSVLERDTRIDLEE